jgi:hypothetical protein
MSFIGYSGVANLALTSSAWAEGVAAVPSTNSDLGEDVGGSTVEWMSSGLPARGYIILQISGDSDPLDFVLQENGQRIRLEMF